MPYDSANRRNEISPRRILGGLSGGMSVGSASFATPSAGNAVCEYASSASELLSCTPYDVSRIALTADEPTLPSALVTSTSPFTFTHDLTEPTTYQFFVECILSPLWTAAGALQGVTLQLVQRRSGGAPQEIAYQCGMTNDVLRGYIDIRATATLQENDTIQAELSAYNASNSASVLTVHRTTVIVRRA